MKTKPIRYQAIITFNMSRGMVVDLVTFKKTMPTRHQALSLVSRVIHSGLVKRNRGETVIYPGYLLYRARIIEVKQ